MSHIRGADRSEVLLFPPALDDYIAQDNPVRFIEAFVLSLDLVEKVIPHDCKLRRVQYLNNVIEQDHRFVKK